MTTPHPATPSAPLSAPYAARQQPAYRARLARSAADLLAVQTLRFEVFNLELDEGLADSYDTGLDIDPFDAVCDHLLVEDDHGGVVGTYRMQTGLQAGAALGYYSEREFDFAPFADDRPRILELGRACIRKNHRNFTVLNLLWKGIGSYAREHGARYLLGCSSLTTQDTAVGAAAYRALRASHLAPPAWRTEPTTTFTCPLQPQATEAPPIPRLLSAYLALGAAICGPPAIDRAFRTVDFLTWLDLKSPVMLALHARGRFIG